MRIELSPWQEQEIRQGRTVQIVDPVTTCTFVVLALVQYEQVRSLLETKSNGHSATTAIAIASEIPPGIRRSQEAYWHDLPNLVAIKSLMRQWVAYHGNEQIGFATTSAELYQECLKRGLKKDEFYVDRVEPRSLPPWEAGIVDASFPWGEAPVDTSA